MIAINAPPDGAENNVHSFAAGHSNDLSSKVLFCDVDGSIEALRSGERPGPITFAPRHLAL